MADKISRYENVEMDLAEGMLTIKVCVDETKVDVQPSASGKTMVVATTGGFQVVRGSLGLKVNLTVVRGK